MAARPVPEVPLDLLEERRSKPPKALLRAELEHAVCLETRRLRLLPVARRGRGLEAVERRGDDVEVGGLRGVFPGARIERADEQKRIRCKRLHVLRRGDAVPANGCGERRTELVELRTQRASACRVSREQRRLDVLERGCGAVPERHGLLDLELERDAPVLDAAAVLDRHELEEAFELSGATLQLDGGERRRAEGLEHPIDACELVCRERSTARRVRDALERASELTLRRDAALGAVDGCEDPPVAERERGHLGACCVVSELVGVLEPRQRAPEACVVGVEEVAAHDTCGRLRRHRPRLELVEGDGRIRGGAREPRRRPELPHEEPASGELRIPSRGGLRGSRERRSEDRGPHGALCGRETRFVIPAAARSASSSARRAVWSAISLPARTASTPARADATFVAAADASPSTSSDCASESARCTSPAASHGAVRPPAAAEAASRRLAATTARKLRFTTARSSP